MSCFRIQPLGDFYRHPATADGHLSMCKGCAKLRARVHYGLTRVERGIYERKRATTPKRRAKAVQYARVSRARHPEKYRARTAVNNAVRDGRLKKRPCAVCGETRKVQAHHADYSKPLDVTWICFACHRQGGHGQIVLHRPL